MGVRVFFASTVFTILFVLSQGSLAPRILGGYEAPSPFGLYHASLQNVTGHHVCGGAVISDQHILTAAHCVKDANPTHIHAVVGTTSLDAGGQRRLVDSITIPEGFSFGDRLNDIAILKMKSKFNLRCVNVLKIYDGDLIEGDPVVLVGFGSKKAHGDPIRQMRALDLSVFSQETCKFAMRYTRNLTDDMFCTFTRIGEGTCHGDSGSPIIKGGELVGVVSWGIPCAVGFPDVHTRVKSHIPWIKAQIKKSTACEAIRFKMRSGKK